MKYLAILFIKSQCPCLGFAMCLAISSVANGIYCLSCAKWLGLAANALYCVDSFGCNKFRGSANTVSTSRLHPGVATPFASPSPNSDIIRSTCLWSTSHPIPDVCPVSTLFKTLIDFSWLFPGPKLNVCSHTSLQFSVGTTLPRILARMMRSRPLVPYK